MTKRKILAAATVAALPLVIGSTQAISRPPTAAAPAADTVRQSEQPAGPQWVWAMGMEGGTMWVEIGMDIVLDCDPRTLGRIHCETLFAL